VARGGKRLSKRHNKTTGALYYDADGSGSGAAIQIGLLDSHPILTYTDVLIF
jgi:hypothetical protein